MSPSARSLLLWVLVAAGCGEADELAEPAPTQWRIPEHFPEPTTPQGTAASQARVEFGRHLFYEERLSLTGEVSCGTCHQQHLAFSDGRARSVGVDGEEGSRSAPSLANVAYQPALTWGNPLLTTLEAHALVPLFVDRPMEMGAQHVIAAELDRMAHDEYRERFEAAFPGEEEPWTIANVAAALAAFQRTIIGGDSAYDRYLQGDDEALGESARRGLVLFESDRLGCSRCHEGILLGSPARSEDEPDARPSFASTGLLWLASDGSYPWPSRGLFELSGDPADLGRHRVPSLRNVALTGPYMHDGSIEDLDGVLDHYAAGGRAMLVEPRVPTHRVLRDPLVTGFELSPSERADLLAFLDSLTEVSVLTDPGLSDPGLSDPDPSDSGPP